MSKKPNPNRMLSWMLVAIMLMGMMPTASLGSGGEVIASFAMPVTELTVEAGTKKADIPLPEMLAATLEDGRTVDIPVNWDDGGLYEKDVAGVYTLAADYGASYVYADAGPYAAVTVKAVESEPESEPEPMVEPEPEAEPEPEPEAEGDAEPIPEPEPEPEPDPELDPESELGSELENDPEPTVYANAISGIVWIDKNKDRVMDADEPRAKGYSVLLLTEQYNLDSAVMSVDTDDNGEYRFENMEPGVYYVAVQTNDMTKAGPLSGDSMMGNFRSEAAAFSNAITVTEDSDIGGIHAGLLTTAAWVDDYDNAVRGIVWLDENGDGVMDDGEARLAGFVVKLASDGETKATVTNEDGAYAFEHLVPGEWRVQVEATREALLPAAIQGDNGIGADGYSETLTIEETTTATLNAGLLANAEYREYDNSISGFVWADIRNDGEYEPSVIQPDGAFDDEGNPVEGIFINPEYPLVGWQVYLVRADDVNSVVATTETNDEGNYRFTNIEPGEYKLKPQTTDTYIIPHIGLVKQNTITTSGTTLALCMAEDSEVSGMDMGMKIDANFALFAGMIPKNPVTGTFSVTAYLKLVDQYGNPIPNVRLSIMGRKMESYANNLSPLRLVTPDTIFGSNRTLENGDAYISFTYSTTVNTGERLGTGGATYYYGGTDPWFGVGILTTDAKLSSASIKRTQTVLRNRSASANGYGAWSKWENHALADQNKAFNSYQMVSWRLASEMSKADKYFRIPWDYQIGKSADEPATIVISYPFTVTEKFEIYNKTGIIIQADQQKGVPYGETYNGSPAATIVNNGVTYQYIGYYLNTETTMNTGNPKITNVKANHTIRYQYSPVYTLSFNADGGTPAPASKMYPAGVKVDQPSAMTKSGYVFVGWYKDSAKTNKWDFATDTMPSSNTTLYAKWGKYYTLSFEANGGTPVPASQSVVEGALASKPTNPTRTGYTFAGWYQNTGLTIVWDFATTMMPAKNQTLYAKWTPLIYTVTFNSNGGSAVANQSVGTGQAVTKPANPTKTGYTFVGWYKEASLTNQWNFTSDKMPAGNLTLHAKWTGISYKVTYVLNGGTGTSSASVPMGELIPKPANPTKSGSIFQGWFKEPTFDNLWDFDTETMPPNDISLYAKWLAGFYNVMFNTNGGTSVAGQIKQAGELLDTPETTTRAGYTFDGWYKDAALTIAHIQNSLNGTGVGMSVSAITMGLSQEITWDGTYPENRT